MGQTEDSEGHSRRNIESPDALAGEWGAELQWLTSVLDARFKQYFNLEGQLSDIRQLGTPEPANPDSPYAGLIRRHGLVWEDRLALALALTPHLRPQLLDVFFTRNKTFDRPFAEFGGLPSTRHSGFLPTGETLLFLLAGADLAERLRVMVHFSPDHPLFSHRILQWGDTDPWSPRQSAGLTITAEALAHLVFGQSYRPDFGMDFPARRIETGMSWDDLVLHPGTLRQLSEIKSWCRHGRTLLQDWEMHNRMRPGYRSLFFGPPGTGKTLTACLLGKDVDRPVYRVDLSMVISKYIGETEKNLSRIFDQAERRDWILFFDEADALFGKRTDTRDAHDRYANQEVSYLLQRIEVFDGIAILASNMRQNLDDAFLRRFESVIYFPMPRPEERQRLWRQSFPARARLAPDLNFDDFAERYELSGGAIMNVVRFASLRALDNGGLITRRDVQEGVERELGKEGKSS